MFRCPFFCCWSKINYTFCFPNENVIKHDSFAVLSETLKHSNNIFCNYITVILRIFRKKCAASVTFVQSGREWVKKRPFLLLQFLSFSLWFIFPWYNIDFTKFNKRKMSSLSLRQLLELRFNTKAVRTFRSKCKYLVRVRLSIWIQMAQAFVFGTQNQPVFSNNLL